MTDLGGTVAGLLWVLARTWFETTEAGTFTKSSPFFKVQILQTLSVSNILLKLFLSNSKSISFTMPRVESLYSTKATLCSGNAYTDYWFNYDGQGGDIE